MNDSPLSISAFVLGIKNLLENSYRNVFIEGEISNLKPSSSGHWYFTLSDNEASISIAFFKMDAYRNPVIKELKNGDKVQLYGSLGVYSKRGTFQVIGKKILKKGKGTLKEEFERLKRQLASEGLFDLDRKLELPSLVNRVAVITAEGSAALADFLNVYERRSTYVDILLVPAQVQGDRAALTLIQALKKIEEYNISTKVKIDVVVITRGGGSLEDLWAFNDERLARTIAQFKIPIVSAVGHQVDFTISDFVADIRCETPTAAAEILSEGSLRVADKLKLLISRLKGHQESELSKLRESLYKFKPDNLLAKILNRLNEFKMKLAGLDLSGRIQSLLGIHEHVFLLEEINFKLNQHSKDLINSKSQLLEHLDIRLKSLNPRSILGRGFSYVETKDGGVIESKKQFDILNEGEGLEICFSDGQGYVIKLKS